jgi:hypothetical protein
VVVASPSCCNVGKLCRRSKHINAPGTNPVPILDSSGTYGQAAMSSMVYYLHTTQCDTEPPFRTPHSTPWQATPPRQRTTYFVHHTAHTVAGHTTKTLTSSSTAPGLFLALSSHAYL